VLFVILVAISLSGAVLYQLMRARSREGATA